MKNIFSRILIPAIGFMLPMVPMEAENQDDPQPGAYYQIIYVGTSGTTLALSYPNSGDYCQIVEQSSSDNNQVWFVEKYGDYYRLHNKGEDKYLGRTDANEWDSKFYGPNDANIDRAKFTLVPSTSSNDYIRIKNLKTGKYMGIDEEKSGANVYMNKDSGGFVKWRLVKLSEPDNCVLKEGTYSITCGDFHLTEKKKSSQGNYYYAEFYTPDAKKPDNNYDAINDLKTFNWSFQIEPVEGRNAVRLKGKNGYVTADGYVDADVTQEQAELFYLERSGESGESGEILAIRRTSDNKYWNTSIYWDDSKHKNIINTHNYSYPKYAFTLTDDVVYLQCDASSGETFVPKNQGVGIAELKRTMKEGSWYTVVLPFTVANPESMFGNGSKVAALTVYTDGCFQFSSTTKMDAGVPYLLKAGQDADTFICTGTREEETNNGLTTSVDGASFIGTYQQITLEAGAYFISSNKLYRAASNNKMNPFRAYLKLAAEASVRAQWFTVDGGTPTAISEIDAPAALGRCYDLSGRQVKQPAKGVYVRDGKKMFIK